MKPMKISKHELSHLLIYISELIEKSDSLEGSVTWSYSNESDDMEVFGSFREGNLLGQGSVVLLNEDQIDGRK